MGNSFFRKSHRQIKIWEEFSREEENIIRVLNIIMPGLERVYSK